jgi:hypothetical protein
MEPCRIMSTSEKQRQPRISRIYTEKAEIKKAKATADYAEGADTSEAKSKRMAELGGEFRHACLGSNYCKPTLAMVADWDGFTDAGPPAPMRLPATSRITSVPYV